MAETSTPTNTPRSKPASAKVAAKKTAARRARTTAQRQTRSAAAANANAARATAREGRSIVERAALVYVGATLEARDRVVGATSTLVDNYGSRTAAERRLKQLEARFERRGTTARNRFERDVKKARTRVERVVRQRTTIDRNPITGVVKTGVGVADRVGNIARERVSAIA